SYYKGYLDYNEKAVVLIIDGYLNYINIEDGTKITEPILIGKDHYVTMFQDYMLLTGIDKKDFIEIVNYNGEIVKKMDLKSNLIDSVNVNIKT
ncbi:MAG: hypothetical protein IJ715_03140, partial [Bacilli bacterium]|nr:hypothetical protein [Bacilli bacterium]